jgi:hypothetical protein
MIPAIKLIPPTSGPVLNAIYRRRRMHRLQLSIMLLCSGNILMQQNGLTDDHGCVRIPPLLRARPVAEPPTLAPTFIPTPVPTATPINGRVGSPSHPPCCPTNISPLPIGVLMLISATGPSKSSVESAFVITTSGPIEAPYPHPTFADALPQNAALAPRLRLHPMCIPIENLPPNGPQLKEPSSSIPIVHKPSGSIPFTGLLPQYPYVLAPPAMPIGSRCMNRPVAGSYQR